MKFFNRFLAAVALMTLVGSSAFAATNKYKDTYTTEDSAGAWTFTNFSRSGQTVPIVTITGPTDTTSSVTAARTGYMYVLTASSGPAVGGVGYTLALPTAASGLNYTFTSATNQTISVRTSGTDKIFYGNAAGIVRITSPASTGTTVTLVGNTGGWYVGHMFNGRTDIGANWTTATS